MIRVVLPWPAAVLWPNRSHGKHWTVSSRAIALAREEAGVLTMVALDGMDTTMYSQAELKVYFYATSAHRYDIANALAALKPAFDGLADALHIDDSNFYRIELVRMPPTQGGGKNVVIEVYLQ